MCDLNLSQFRHLGLQLGLLQSTLSKISHTEALDYGNKVMTDWLNQVDNAETTWNNLVEASFEEKKQSRAMYRQMRF